MAGVVRITESNTRDGAPGEYALVRYSRVKSHKFTLDVIEIGLRW